MENSLTELIEHADHAGEFAAERNAESAADVAAIQETEQEQTDPLSLLQVWELDAGSRRLKTDLVEACRPGNPQRWEALAVVAWLFARREDKTETVDRFRSMRANELSEVVLGYAEQYGSHVDAEGPTRSA